MVFIHHPWVVGEEAGLGDASALAAVFKFFTIREKTLIARALIERGVSRRKHVGSPLFNIILTRASIIPQSPCSTKPSTVFTSVLSLDTARRTGGLPLMPVKNSTLLSR